eukprot:1009906-Pelagomonas_calceolata.AAC.1
MPTWKCEIIVRTVDLMEEIQQRDPSNQATVPTHMPQVLTCEAACISNTKGKCVGMLRRKEKKEYACQVRPRALRKGHLS